MEVKSFKTLSPPELRGGWKSSKIGPLLERWPYALEITITTITITITSVRITITIITIMTITIIPRQNTKEEFQDLHFIFYERLCDDPVSQTFDNFMIGFLYPKG